MNSFVCSCCGQTHDGIPLSFAAHFPDAYADLSEDERQSRAVLSSDQCIIDNELHFLRGLIEIPILGQETPFLWGAWTLVFVDDFNEISESWHEEGRENKRGPFKGRLANQLSNDLAARNLKISIKIRPVGQRPLFFLDEPHKLQTQQRDGMSLVDAQALASHLLHEFEGT